MCMYICIICLTAVSKQLISECQFTHSWTMQTTFRCLSQIYAVVHVSQFSAETMITDTDCTGKACNPHVLWKIESVDESYRDVLSRSEHCPFTVWHLIFAGSNFCGFFHDPQK